MLARRVIPCLDVHAGHVTRGVQFGRAEAGELRNVGDPVELAIRYNEQGADEMVFFDITASAHGRANAAEFSYLAERGAFTRDSATGRYRVDFPRMRAAVDSLGARILRFQGDGDHEGVTAFMAERGKIPGTLQRDLDRLGTKGIPVDIVLEQGVGVLGMGGSGT